MKLSRKKKIYHRRKRNSSSKRSKRSKRVMKGGAGPAPSHMFKIERRDGVKYIHKSHASGLGGGCGVEAVLNCLPRIDWDSSTAKSALYYFTQQSETVCKAKASASIEMSGIKPLVEQVTLALIATGNGSHLRELANNRVSSLGDPDNVAKGLVGWLAPLLCGEYPLPLVVQAMGGYHFVAYRPIEQGRYCKIDAFSSLVLNMNILEVYEEVKEGLGTGVFVNVNAIVPIL